MKMFQAGIRCLLSSTDISGASGFGRSSRGRVFGEEAFQVMLSLSLMFLSSHARSFAKKVQKPELRLAAVKRYWNACLPLALSGGKRAPLRVLEEAADAKCSGA